MGIRAGEAVMAMLLLGAIVLILLNKVSIFAQRKSP